MTRQVLVEAMEEAEEAFEQYIDEQSLDPAYFDLELTGYLLGGDFKPKRSAKFLPEFEHYEEDGDRTV